jgi:hypothetical protein
MKYAVFSNVAPCGIVRTDVSRELAASVFWVETICELGITLRLTGSYCFSLLVTANAVPS